MNTWYYSDAPRTVAPQLDQIRRQGSFDEVARASTRTTRCSRRAAA
jgi:hypothetical protein